MHPQPSRRQRVALLIELRVRNWPAEPKPAQIRVYARLGASHFVAAAFACRDVAGEGWWEVLVMLQFVTSDFIF